MGLGEGVTLVYRGQSKIYLIQDHNNDEANLFTTFTKNTRIKYNIIGLMY